MVTTTYLVLIVALAGVLWWVTVRSRRGTTTRDPRGQGPAGARLRAMIAGIAGGEDDLVERMAVCLVDHTTVFGSSYAIPGHLGAELPQGVFEAASAARPQLTAEVLEHYRGTMVERCRRAGRPEFALPDGYTLRVVLACGPVETVVASFTPIVDVRASLAAAGRTGPLPITAAEDDDRTVTRHGGGGPDGGSGETVQLSVDGVTHARLRVGGRTPVLTLGRGRDAELRCPDDLHEVSRRHAELTRLAGRTYVEDKHSANGTRIQRADGEWVELAPGTPEPVTPGDVVWLDAGRDAKVTVL